MNNITSNNISSINNSVMSTLSEYKDKYSNLLEATKKIKEVEESISSKLLELIPVTNSFAESLAEQYSKFIIWKTITIGAIPFDKAIYNQLNILEKEVNNLQDCLSSSNSSFEEIGINILCEKVGQDTCATSTQLYCNIPGLGLNPSNFDKVLDGNVYGTCTNWYEACSNQFADCDNSTVCYLSFAESLDCTYEQGCGLCEANCQHKCQKACQSTCEVSCEANCQSACQSVCEGSCQNCEANCQDACQTSCQSACQFGCQGCLSACQSSCASGCQAGCDKSCQRCQGNVCQVSCQDICQDVCQSDCQDVCQSACEFGCQSACEAGCESNCQKSCQSGCQTSCQNTCEVSCQVLDQNTCTMSSESGCNTISDINYSCLKFCQSGCEASCEGIVWQITCEYACQSIGQ